MILADEHFERLASKFRMVEDALQRALDQLEEDEPKEKSWDYVRNQVDKAHTWIGDAAAIMLAHMKPG